jgi:hypothetical protein
MPWVTWCLNVNQGRVEKGMVVLDQPLPLPDGTPVQVKPIAAPHASFWESYSLDDLARQQGISAAGTIEDLLRGWPADDQDDDFEEAFRRWRESELEHRS